FNGVAFTAFGTAMAFVGKDDPHEGWVRVLGATTAIVLVGAPSLVFGIRGLFESTAPDEVRLARFRAQRTAGPLDAISLARYEGELSADADRSRRLRVLGGWYAVGVAVGGATLIGYGAASPVFDDARVLAYAEGGALLAFGTILAISELGGESATEREWRL